MEESINPQQDPKQEQDQQQKEQSTGSNPEQKAEASDVEKNKLMAVIGYVLPILFFIPLLTDAKESKFAMFHANQHLVLLIFVIAVNAFGTIIPILGWFLILPIGIVALIVIAIIGAVNAAKGEMKPLLVIGGIQIIK